MTWIKELQALHFNGVRKMKITYSNGSVGNFEFDDNIVGITTGIQATNLDTGIVSSINSDFTISSVEELV